MDRSLFPKTDRSGHLGDGIRITGGSLLLVGGGLQLAATVLGGSDVPAGVTAASLVVVVIAGILAIPLDLAHDRTSLALGVATAVAGVVLAVMTGPAAIGIAAAAAHVAAAIALGTAWEDAAPKPRPLPARTAERSGSRRASR